MSQENKCPVCLEPEQKINAEGVINDSYFCQCIRCGDYHVSDKVRIRLLNSENEIKESNRANISGWLREHPGSFVSSYNLETLLELKNPSVAEKAQKLLKAIDEECSVIGQQIPIEYDDKSWWAASWSFSATEINYLLNAYLTGSQGLLIGKGTINAGMYQISPEGYAYLQKIRETNENSQIGFCAMWFNPETSELWSNGIEPAITSAGYKPFRIDKHDHVNRIDDEIIASIRRSKFCVADFTHGESGVRGGVYFEAGFALGLGLQVVWTCRKDFIKDQKIHFDLRQYNFLEWDSAELGDFATRLQNRIESIFGRGGYKREAST